MNYKSLLAYVFVLPAYLGGMVFESDRFSSIMDCVESIPVNKEILVVCDLDNTLMESTQHLGSVAWGESVVEELKSKGLSHKDAQWTEDLFWGAVHKIMKVKTVDPMTSEIIAAIQNKGIRVLGLTARLPTLSETTVRQVQSLGIDLTLNDPQIGLRQEFVLDYAVVYEDGVLSSSVYNKKSKTLEAFLDRNGLHPDWVIFVDDKMHHTADVENFLQNRGIGCYCIRFSGADQQAKTYDSRIADIQWKAFPEIVTDDEARRMLQ